MRQPSTSSRPRRWANSSTRRSPNPSTAVSPCTPSSYENKYSPRINTDDTDQEQTKSSDSNRTAPNLRQSVLLSVFIRVKPLMLPMCRLLQLAAALLLTATLGAGQPPPASRPRRASPPRIRSPSRERGVDLAVHARRHSQGRRENDLVPGSPLHSVLQQFLTAPRPSGAAPQRTLPLAGLDRARPPLRPDKSLPKRTATSPSLAASSTSRRARPALDRPQRRHHLVVFAASTGTNRVAQPATPPPNTPLGLPDDPLRSPAPRVIRPPHSQNHRPLGRPALAGSGVVQNITHAMLVDPDGTPHEVAPAALGVAPPPAPKSDTDTTAPVLSRN